MFLGDYMQVVKAKLANVTNYCLLMADKLCADSYK